MNFEESQIFPGMDPELQRVMQQAERDQQLQTEIAVIVKVDNIERWNAREGITQVAQLAQTREGYYLVTARLRIGDLPEVRQWPEVLSVKSGRRTRPQLDAAVPDVNAQLNMLPANIEGNQGEGVVIGIIDSGGDFTHQNFRRADGATRIEAIWDQRIEQPSNSPFGYGRVYSEAELNEALEAFDNAPAVQYYGNLAFERPSHGTHVMDIAGGNGQGTGAPGVAPNATLVFVHAAPADIRFLGPSVVGSDFGDSIRLAEAVRFILDQAGDRPCVINISLGTNGGPHDGSNPVEESIDAMLSQAPNRAVVISAGNAFADGIHTSGQVSQTRSVDLSWEIGPFDPTHNEIEIWYPQGDEFTAQLILPDGRALQPVGLGTNGRIRDDDGNVLIFIAHRENDPNNGDNVIGLYMEAGLPSGTWTVRLQGVRVQNGEFHAWIERDDPGQSSFSPLQHDNRFTLGSLACGHKSIVVGSYDAREPSKPLSVFSSSGPTRDGRQKPEVSAPGHGVKAAYSKTISGNASMSGTSMAAPMVTGIVALMLAEAKSRGRDLNIDEIRALLTETARPSPATVGLWHERYGFGRADARAILERLLN